MLDEFAGYIQGIFPSLDPALRESLRKAARQFGDVEADLFPTQLTPNISQGDVIAGLVFELENEDGEIIQQEVSGMLISPSCDYDNDLTVTLAPCYPWSWFEADANAASIRANEITNKLYVPASGRRSAIVVDLSALQTFRSSYIRSGIEQGVLRKVEGFTQLGWWFLIAKLTLHFMRPESADDLRGNAVPSFMERVENVARQLPGLIRYLVTGRA